MNALIEIEQIWWKGAPDYELSSVEPNIFKHLLLSTSLMQQVLITMKLGGFQMVGHKV